MTRFPGATEYAQRMVRYRALVGHTIEMDGGRWLVQALLGTHAKGPRVRLRNAISGRVATVLLDERGSWHCVSKVPDGAVRGARGSGV